MPKPFEYFILQSTTAVNSPYYAVWFGLPSASGYPVPGSKLCMDMLTYDDAFVYLSLSACFSENTKEAK